MLDCGIWPRLGRLLVKLDSRQMYNDLLWDILILDKTAIEDAWLGYFRDGYVLRKIGVEGGG